MNATQHKEIEAKIAGLGADVHFRRQIAYPLFIEPPEPESTCGLAVNHNAFESARNEVVKEVMELMEVDEETASRILYRAENNAGQAIRERRRNR